VENAEGLVGKTVAEYGRYRLVKEKDRQKRIQNLKHCVFFHNNPLVLNTQISPAVQSCPMILCHIELYRRLYPQAAGQARIFCLSVYLGFCI